MQRRTVMRVRGLNGWCLVALGAVLVTASVGAAGGDASLVEAVRTGNTATMRALLQQHVDVNMPTTDGTTALHVAADRQDLVAADLLIRAHANVKATNRYGVT